MWFVKWCFVLVVLEVWSGLEVFCYVIGVVVFCCGVVLVGVVFFCGFLLRGVRVVGVVVFVWSGVELSLVLGIRRGGELCVGEGRKVLGYVLM